MFGSQLSGGLNSEGIAVLAWRSPIEGIAMIRRIAITAIVAAFVGLLGFPVFGLAAGHCPDQAP
jgi:hypothetical protein